MIEVAVRILVALVVVLGLMWAIARVARRPLGGRGGAVAVMARQPLTRTASVAVVRVGEQAYVLGVTDQNVSLLAEADPAAIEAAASSHEVREKVPLDALGPKLAGSALSPATWRQAVDALRGGRK
jgi:flagellar protein FliO/FliZ